MLNSLSYFFNKLNGGFDGRLLDGTELKKVGMCKHEYPDAKKKQSASKPKKRVRFESSEALLKKGDDHFGGGEKPGVKIKILMTKEEAARLLSKCKDGGVLELEDVARELVQVPINRVSLVSSAGGRGSTDCAVQSIKHKDQ